MRLKQLLLTFRWLMLFAVIVGVLAPEWPAFGDERHRLQGLISGREFDFVVWWTGAALDKGTAGLAEGQAFLSPETRRDVVLATLQLMGEAKGLENEVQAIFSDPSIADPVAASGEAAAALARVRAELARMQPLAEAVIEEQVAALLTEDGFGFLGHVWPPVQMRMTPLPLVLVVSPRDEIRQLYSFSLTPGMIIPERQALEDAVLAEVDRSALVVPIGGLGIFPAMVIETANINFLVDTVAHEWAHHWLTLHPLGLNYNASAELRTINETVASIVGTEIGQRVIERYYPKFVPAPPPPATDAAPAAEPSFDFRAEMAATRIRTDELLADGLIDEAEAYMEERRKVFVDEGYNLRRLNQAYFAFYGAYADTPGATGEDPIGPAVTAVRVAAGSLAAFMRQVAGITSAEELFALAGVDATR